MMPVADAGMVLTDGMTASSDLLSETVPTDPCDTLRCGPYGVCAEGECLCEEGYGLVEGVCVDVDECAAETPVCGDGALCVNLPGSYQCTCAAGRIGSSKHL